MKRLAILLLASVTGACTMGPHDLDAHASLPPALAAQTFAPVSGGAQTTTLPSVPAEWWRGFGSAQLDTLVAEAQAHATDIAVAEATLRQYREQGSATAGSALPQADVNYQAERTRISNALSPAVADQNQQLYTLHTAQVTVSYAPDLFGGTRSKIRSARAATETQRQRLAAARTTVIANLVEAVIQRGSLAEQIAEAQIAITVNRDILQTLVKRQQLGAVGAADVSTQQAALANAEGALPPLVRAEAHQRVVIGTLIGRSAGSDLPPLPTLASLTLPRDLPLVVPSDLVARRPDVLAARAQLEGAGADVGTAIAARLPAISLSGSAGGTAEHFGDMFKSGNPFWTLIGGITQPIFHAGALRHQQHAAEAALEGAKASYRAAVLQAFGDVSDALTGLMTDADALDSATRATDASGRALNFVRRQLALGDVGTPALLNATATDAQARGQAVQARAARLSDTVALFQAAGGGVSGVKSMGGITGATSGKFVLMAATLLFHGRVDNARTTIAIVPGAPHSAIGATLANRIAHRDRVKIGIRAEYLYAPITAVEPDPAAGADIRIGQDILDANPIEIDFPHRELRLLLAGEAPRVECGMTAIPVTHQADGTVTVPLTLDAAPPTAAVLDLAHATDVTAPTVASAVALGRSVLKDVVVTPGATPSVGLAAFKRMRVIFDLGHDRIWIGM